MEILLYWVHQLGGAPPLVVMNFSSSVYLYISHSRGFAMVLLPNTAPMRMKFQTFLTRPCILMNLMSLAGHLGLP